MQMEEQASFFEPDNEEAGTKASRGPAHAQEWAVKVQCWGPAFVEGVLQDCLKAAKTISALPKSL